MMSLFHSNCFWAKGRIYVGNMTERKNHSDLSVCLLSHMLYQFNYNKTGNVRCQSFRTSPNVCKGTESQGALDGDQKHQ